MRRGSNDVEVLVSVATLRTLRDWREAGGQIRDCCIAPNTSACAGVALDILIGRIPKTTCDCCGQAIPSARAD